MRRRTINVDETKALLDGSNTQAGGRPAMSFRDPHLPQIMKSVAKSSYECTAIFGSNAAGELVPVYFQLPTSATSAEREKLRYDFCLHLKNTRGQFGHDKVREWPCGIGMNEIQTEDGRDRRSRRRRRAIPPIRSNARIDNSY
jgi:hypothetical protein